MPVFVAAVLDHLQTALRVEVHVDIRQRHALRVQEPFEDQTMLQGIELGDAHCIGDHRSCRGATARPHHDPMVFGPLDVISHHQEVAWELHLADHTALVIRLRQHMRRHIALVPPFEALLHFLQEQRGLVPTLRAWELGHERAVLVVVEHHIATFRHLDRIVARLGQVAEQLAHLLRGTHVIPFSIELEPVRIIQVRA